jgi:hypothetical protein
MRKSLLLNSIITFLILTLISSVSAQWIESGVVVSAADDWQLNPVLVPDDSSGVIIAWEDRRNSGSIDNQDIYAQRVDADGYVKWALNDVVVCDAANRQAYARIASDGNGGAIIIWTDNRSGEYDIYAQRLNRNGIPLWSSDGILVCGALGNQFGPALVSDGAGGAIIAWKDYRDAHDDYYAQRIDDTGTRMWDAGGVAISTVAVGYMASIGNPEMISDGSGGAIIAWADRRNGPYMVHAQRITVDGIVLWVEDGVPVSDVVIRHAAYHLVSDNDRGAIITWIADREDVTLNDDIYAQRIRFNGEIAWNTAGVPVCVSSEWRKDVPRIGKTVDGGAIIVWTDFRKNIDYDTDIYAQRLDSLGNVEWDINGIPICDAMTSQGYPRIISGVEDETVISWKDDRNGTGDDIYIQRLSESGAPYWENNGRVFYLAPASSAAGWHEMVMPDAESIVMTWYENREQESIYDIFLKKINMDGSIPISTLLQHSSSSIDGNTITLNWEISEDVLDIRFIVSRAEDDGEIFRELFSGDIVVDGNRYSLKDNTCAYGGSYRYRVEYLEDEKWVVLFETDSIDIPTVEFELGQNFPNPFNPLTTIGYSVKERCRVTIEVLDVSGRRVCTLTDGVQESGRYEVRWDGCDEAGREVSSGVYFYQLKAGKTVVSRKMILLK